MAGFDRTGGPVRVQAPRCSELLLAPIRPPRQSRRRDLARTLGGYQRRVQGRVRGWPRDPPRCPRASRSQASGETPYGVRTDRRRAWWYRDPARPRRGLGGPDPTDFAAPASIHELPRRVILGNWVSGVR